MGAGSVKKSGSKDDLDLLTKRVCTPLLRHAGVIYLGNFFRISQETFKRSEYLSVETVRETFGDRELIYDGEARKRSNSRYHVDAPLLRHTRDIYTSNVFFMGIADAIVISMGYSDFSCIVSHFLPIFNSHTSLCFITVLTTKAIGNAWEH
ncbi:hypothetical protein RHGRI_019396 [Rhododendron griersonianum]|uniref:Uncharacterized protein n=1 Tax=Rhododendron griersonianum TaxID=479676 RepID=A0AAV6JCD5_9ERIC|nr:hypothetical protein RHGRI_019396 [Rhododendron griersonianum]